jgi:hypothetical protein
LVRPKCPDSVNLVGARRQSRRRWFGESISLSEHVVPQFVMRKRWRRLVRAEGLEPPQLSSLEPKSSASTSSATPAECIMSGRDASGMIPESARRFSDAIMLQVIEIDHLHDFG